MGAIERWLGGGSVDRLAAVERRAVERVEMREIERAEDLACDRIEARSLARALEYALETELNLLEHARRRAAGDPYASRLAAEKVELLARTNAYRAEDTWSRPPRRRR